MPYSGDTEAAYELGKESGYRHADFIDSCQGGFYHSSQLPEDSDIDVPDKISGDNADAYREGFHEGCSDYIDRNYYSTAPKER